MSKQTIPSVGVIYSGDSKVKAEGKTLIITAHGRMTGTQFKPAYATSLQFASPRYGALLAALSDAISGKVTATQVALPGSSTEDHAIAHYDCDPPPSKIVELLEKAPSFDVLVVDSSISSTRAPNAPKLSEVIATLKQQGLAYPAILCLFCRVVKKLDTGVALKSFDVTGAKHLTAMLEGQKMKDAISIAQALKAAGKVKL